MRSADGLAMGMVALAGAIGIAAVWMLWSRIRHRSAQARHTHPATLAPVVVNLVGVGGDHRWRIDLRPGAPATTIDIFSYRPRRPDAPWDTEGLAHPIEIRPGGHAIVPTRVESGDGRFDVVVAWTVHHPAGDVQGSRTFAIPEVAGDAIALDEPRMPWGATLGAVVVSVVLVAVSALAIAEAADRWSDGSPAASPSAPTEPTVATTAPTAPSTAPPSTPPTAPSTAPPSTPSTGSDPAPPVTTTPPSAPPTSESPTTVTTPATTVAPATTAAPSTTEATAGGPTVTITGRIGECRFGSECLIASFEIDGFAGRPQEFVCEFEDGNRFTFRFDSGGVVDACATGTATAAITIEVEGVRSRTITRADV